MRQLNFLIDTNVLIALDPLSVHTDESLRAAGELQRRIAEGGHRLFVHPRVDEDLRRDRDPHRQATRRRLLDKYTVLPDAPEPTAEMVAAIGSTPPKRRGNSDVDNAHLAAVCAGAVSWLVTEDGGLRRKAAAVGVAERVGTIPETLEFLQRLSPEAPPPPLQVVRRKAHALKLADPIFDGLRADYAGFDKWFREKCVAEHRDVFVIADGAALAAVCIVKPEPAAEGQTLKLCTVKVADGYNGFRYGELLLRTVIEHCRGLRVDAAYVTVLPKHDRLVDLLGDFGFVAAPSRTPLGELLLHKQLRPHDGVTVHPLTHHVLYGPGALRLRTGEVFVVPVQPDWHRSLFPDAGVYERELFPQPLSNAVRKAYLCRAGIRRVGPGALLLFYRSADHRHVAAVGVVEDVTVSRDAELITGRVGKRTVYGMTFIESMCAEGEVLAIRFRQDRVLDPPISYRDLLNNGVLKGPPQTVTPATTEGGVQWLRDRLNA